FGAILRAAAAGKASGPAAAFGLPRASRSLDVLLEKKRHLREGADGRLVVELAAVELARLPSARDLDALIEALRAEGSARATAASPPLARATPLSRPSSGPSRVAESVAPPAATAPAPPRPPA